MMKEEESLSKDIPEAATLASTPAPTQENKKPVLKDEEKEEDECCDCWGCCTFPQGGRAIQTLILALPAFLLMATALGGCNFVRMEDEDELSNHLGWGLLWRQETEVEAEQFDNRQVHCTAFDDEQKDEFDGLWKTSMAFAVLAIIVTTITALTTISLSCATFSQRYVKLMATGFWMALVFQGLSYVGLASDMCDSDSDCILSFGSGILIGSLCLTLMAGGSAWMIQPAHPKKATVMPQPEPVEELADQGSSTLAAEEEAVHVSSEEGEEKEEEVTASKDEEEGGWQEDWEEEDEEEAAEHLSDEALGDISEEEEEVEVASTEQKKDTVEESSAKKEENDTPTTEAKAEDVKETKEKKRSGPFPWSRQTVEV